MKTKEKKFLSQVALAVFVTFSGVTAEARVARVCLMFLLWAITSSRTFRISGWLALPCIKTMDIRLL